VFPYDELHLRGVALEYFFTVFLDSPTFGKEDQAFIGEFVAIIVDEGSFVGAEATPGVRNSRRDDFAFD